MPTYTVELNGKKFDIQGDRPPTADEAGQALQSFKTEENRRVINQGLSGLALDIPNIGNKPLSEVLAGQIGSGIDAGTQLAQKLSQLKLSQLPNIALSGPAGIGSAFQQNQSPTPILEGTLNSRFGVPAPALPQTPQGQIMGQLANMGGQALTFGGLEGGMKTLEGLKAPNLGPIKPPDIIPPGDALQTRIENAQTNKLNNMNVPQIKEHMEEVKSDLNRQIKDVSTKAEAHAHDLVPVIRQAATDYNNAFYQKYGAKRDQLLGDVQVKSDFLENALRDHLDQNKLLGDGARAPSSPQEAKLLHYYKAITKDASDLPPSLLNRLNSPGGQKFQLPKDPALKANFLEKLKASGQLPKGKTSVEPFTTNLSEVFDALKTPQVKGFGKPGVNSVDAFKNSLMDKLANEQGVNVDREALGKLQQEYQRFAGFRETMDKTFDINANRGANVSRNTSNGADFIMKYTKGEIPEDANGFVNEIKSRLNIPGLDAQINGTPNSTVPGYRPQLADLKKQVNDIGYLDQYETALKNAKTRAQKESITRNWKTYLEHIGARKVVYTALGRLFKLL